MSALAHFTQRRHSHYVPNKDSSCRNCCGGSLVPVASFPGSRWVVPAGTDYSRHTRFLRAVGDVQQMRCVPQEGKKPRKVGTPVLPLFSHGPLFNHLPRLSTGHCADSGTQRQHGSTGKGVSNSMQLFHTSSQFSIAFSLH